MDDQVMERLVAIVDEIKSNGEQDTDVYVSTILAALNGPGDPVAGSFSATIDADYGADGWEIVARVDAESMEAAWTDVSDDSLQAIVGALAEVLIRARGAETGQNWETNEPLYED